jgi:hypothetical protein
MNSLIASPLDLPAEEERDVEGQLRLGEAGAVDGADLAHRATDELHRAKQGRRVLELLDRAGLGVLQPLVEQAHDRLRDR